MIKKKNRDIFIPKSKLGQAKCFEQSKIKGDIPE
jgi:hypothetical protein